MAHSSLRWSKSLQVTPSTCFWELGVWGVGRWGGSHQLRLSLEAGRVFGGWGLQSTVRAP